MKELIKPTTEAPIDEKTGEKEEITYILEDKDYLLISAIRDLTNEIQKLRLSK